MFHNEEGNKSPLSSHLSKRCCLDNDFSIVRSLYAHCKEHKKVALLGEITANKFTGILHPQFLDGGIKQLYSTGCKIQLFPLKTKISVNYGQ